MNKKDKRKEIVKLHFSGKSERKISKTLGIATTTVHNAIKRFNEKGDLSDRKRTRKPTVAVTSLVEKLKKRVKRNPRCSMRQVAKQLKVNRETVRKIVLNKLKCRPYKMRECQELTLKKKQMRLERCQALLKSDHLKNLNNILFTDEKLFTIEQSFNHQNDRIWATSKPKEKAIVSRIQKPLSVMVWAGITSTSKTPLIFIEDGVKINQVVYRQMLDDSVLPWANATFGASNWIFQQDSAPSHRAELTQKWIQEHFPSFITAKEWPPYSPDLNPMDFSMEHFAAESMFKTSQKLEIIENVTSKSVE